MHISWSDCFCPALAEKMPFLTGVKSSSRSASVGPEFVLEVGQQGSCWVDPWPRELNRPLPLQRWPPAWIQESSSSPPPAPSSAGRLCSQERPPVVGCPLPRTEPGLHTQGAPGGLSEPPTLTEGPREAPHRLGPQTLPELPAVLSSLRNSHLNVLGQAKPRKVLCPAQVCTRVHMDTPLGQPPGVCPQSGQEPAA